MHEQNERSPNAIGRAFQDLIIWAMGTYPKIRNQGECDPGTWTERKRSSRLPQDETAPKLTKTILKRFVDSPAVDGFSKEKLSDNEAKLTMHLRALLGSEVDPKLKTNHKEIADAVREAISDARLGRPRKTRRIAQLDDAVTTYMNSLLADNGIPVVYGIVHLTPETEIDLEPLAQYIRFLQDPPEISNYFPGIPKVRLDKLYVELTATDERRVDHVSTSQNAADNPLMADPVAQWKSKARTKRISLDTLLASTDNDPAVLFGDPGSGKSTLIQFALHSLGIKLLAKDINLSSKKLPFRIPLREFAQDGAKAGWDIARYIAWKALRIADNNLQIQWGQLIERLLKSRHRIFLLLDGIDEVTSNREQFSKIHDTIVSIEPAVQVLMTSRRAGFQPITSHCSPFELIDLCTKSISAMILNWFQNVWPKPHQFIESFQRWVLEDASRREMAGNPCLLSLLCFLNQDCSETTFIQARNRAEMYQRAVDKLTSDTRAASSMKRDPALDTLARFALARYTSPRLPPVQQTVFNVEEIRQFFSNLRRSHVFDHTTPTFSEIEDRWLKTRIITQFNQGAWYQFLHLSFQEYFAALELMNLDIADVELLVDAHQFNPFWAEVWRFYSGLCALAGGSGLIRFKSIAQKYFSPGDLFGECLWRLAPLMAENGLRDSRDLLGFDLRTVLLNDFEYVHVNPKPKVRVMVSIDPMFFVEHAIEVLSPGLEYYQGLDEELLHSWEYRKDVIIAKLILECIETVESVELQVALVTAQIQCKVPIEIDTPYHRVASQHRNRANASVKNALISHLKDGIHQPRLIFILEELSRLGARGTLDYIMTIVRQVSLRQSCPQISPDEAKANQYIQLACLDALCSLQAPEAIELAAHLWKQSWFREGQVYGSTFALAELSTAAVGELAEQWLEEAGLVMDSLTLGAVLDLLTPWGSENFPACIDKLIALRSQNMCARIMAFRTVIKKGGHAGRERVRLQLLELGKHRKLSASMLKEIEGLAGVLPEVYPGFFKEWHALSKHRDCCESPNVSHCIDLALTRICVALPLVREHQEWLETRVVPELHRLLGRLKMGGAQLDNFPSALKGGPVAILAFVADKIEEIWLEIDYDTRCYFLSYFFKFYPHLTPRMVLQFARKSLSRDVRETAISILLNTDPGELVCQRHIDVEAFDKLLFNSKNLGFIYFEDRYYSPYTLRCDRYKTNYSIDRG